MKMLNMLAHSTAWIMSGLVVVMMFVLLVGEAVYEFVKGKGSTLVK